MIPEIGLRYHFHLPHASFLLNVHHLNQRELVVMHRLSCLSLPFVVHITSQHLSTSLVPLILQRLNFQPVLVGSGVFMCLSSICIGVLHVTVVDQQMYTGSH